MPRADVASLELKKQPPAFLLRRLRLMIFAAGSRIVVTASHSFENCCRDGIFNHLGSKLKTILLQEFLSHQVNTVLE
jgi:hypothetical protein